MRRRCSHEPHISPCYNFCTAHSHNTWCRKELMQVYNTRIVRVAEQQTPAPTDR
ncbi:hypothetical protein H4S06_000797 [Coemansia sp. BCRC 34490]|nr:hypothetical protein H4S06_000797 [Coemansia sp. BCRC 34490]